jgi:hypothetical protein
MSGLEQLYKKKKKGTVPSHPAGLSVYVSVNVVIPEGPSHREERAQTETNPEPTLSYGHRLYSTSP